MLKIFCPQCGWIPPRSALWICAPTGCGFAWHTFDTHGQCPNCFKQWKETSCHHCKQWSLHDDWYHDNEPIGEEEKEETLAR